VDRERGREFLSKTMRAKNYLSRVRGRWQQIAETSGRTRVKNRKRSSSCKLGWASGEASKVKTLCEGGALRGCSETTKVDEKFGKIPLAKDRSEHGALWVVGKWRGRRKNEGGLGITMAPDEIT